MSTPACKRGRSNQYQSALMCHSLDLEASHDFKGLADSAPHNQMRHIILVIAVRLEVE
jgi:hypothetical protein